MLDNYSDLEKKPSLLDDQESSFLFNTPTISADDSLLDYQNFIQQQKQLIQQIHKQERKLKQFSNVRPMTTSVNYKSKLTKMFKSPLLNTNNFLLKPIKSDMSPLVSKKPNQLA